MLCIEFPSASPADVTRPRALHLCGAARALLGHCSQLKTPIFSLSSAPLMLSPTPGDTDATYFILFIICQVKDMGYKNLFTCLLSSSLRRDF